VSVAQRLVIKSTCILALRLQLAAERMAEGTADGDHYARELVAVANGIRLNCVTLGMERPAEVPNLQRYLEGRATKAA
jgi:predicted homoserine dehydrogenase-like protein